MGLTAVFPLYPGFDTLDVLGPLQAFLYAGITSTLAAAQPGGVTSLEQVTVQATEGFDSETQHDILFVPGGSDIPSVLALGPSETNPYLRYLRRQAQGAQLVCSVCTGALLLAAAGLLDHRAVTTHWAYKDVLRLFPCHVVDDYRRYVQSGNVITGGGISSGIDEALYIIATAAGIEKARRAQLAMQYHPQPLVHCGDPGQPDLRDIPDLPASIQSDWHVQDTLEDVRNWLAGPRATSSFV
jgi:cyclohexyl-isocyanide hydratase